MNHSLTKISRDDILSAIGLQTRRSPAAMLLPSLGLFSVGLVVGAGLGLLFAPKSGKQTREVIGTGINGMAKRVASTMRRDRHAAQDEGTHDDAFEVGPGHDGVSARHGTSNHADLNGPRS